MNSLFNRFLIETHDEIQELAENKKSGASYLVDLIGKNLPIIEIAYDIDESIKEEEYPEIIYNKVKSTIEELEYEYITLNSIEYDLTMGAPFHPAVELSWARFTQSYLLLEKNNFSSNLKLTKKGIEVINGYRNAMGFISLEEHREINKNSQNLDSGL